MYEGEWEGIDKYGGYCETDFYEVYAELKPNPIYYKKSYTKKGYYRHPMLYEEVLFKSSSGVCLKICLDEIDEYSYVYDEAGLNYLYDIKEQKGYIYFYVKNIIDPPNSIEIKINVSDGEYEYDTIENEQYMLETYGLTADDIIKKVSDSQKIFWRDYDKMYIKAIGIHICKIIIFVIIEVYLIKKIIKEEKEQG